MDPCKKTISTTSIEIDPGPLRPASPPASEHASTASGVPRVPRRLMGGVQRPASAGSAGLTLRQLDVNASPPTGTRQNRGWPFEDPFLLTSLSPQLQRRPQNYFNDLAVASGNRVSTVSSIRQTSSGGVPGGSDPYLSTKHHWTNSYLNNSLKYTQGTEEPLCGSQWNTYNECIFGKRNSSKELSKSLATKWPCHAETDQQSRFSQKMTQPNPARVRPHSKNRPESLVRVSQDYEALIQNMEEVEEREIKSCLRDDFYARTDVGDWSEDSIHVPLDTVMLENFEELEQLIQEEDDDVQMALHIQDQQFLLQRGKNMDNDYLELQKPIYQGKTDYDESDDDLSPEVAAAMMHSEERGILMGSAPSRVYKALFSDCEKDPLAVFSAGPFHAQSVVVPTAGGEIPYSASAEDLTALASVSLGEEPPNSSVFSDILKTRGSYEAVMTEASKAYTDGQDDCSDRLSLASLPHGRNLEYVLDPASPPAHFSKVQLRGSILPNWFPGYYKALPHIKGITAVCSDPGIVMEDAWWTLQTTLA